MERKCNCSIAYHGFLATEYEGRLLLMPIFWSWASQFSLMSPLISQCHGFVLSDTWRSSVFQGVTQWLGNMPGSAQVLWSSGADSRKCHAEPAVALSAVQMWVTDEVDSGLRAKLPLWKDEHKCSHHMQIYVFILTSPMLFGHWNVLKRSLTWPLQEKRGLFSASCHLLQKFPSNQSVSLSPPQHTLDISPTISAPACVLGEQNPCSVRVIGKMMQSCSLLHPNVCVDFHANHMPSKAPPAITCDRRYKSAI